MKFVLEHSNNLLNLKFSAPSVDRFDIFGLGYISFSLIFAFVFIFCSFLFSTSKSQLIQNIQIFEGKQALQKVFFSFNRFHFSFENMFIILFVPYSTFHVSYLFFGFLFFQFSYSLMFDSISDPGVKRMLNTKQNLSKLNFNLNLNMLHVNNVFLACTDRFKMSKHFFFT